MRGHVAEVTWRSCPRWRLVSNFSVLDGAAQSMWRTLSGRGRGWASGPHVIFGQRMRRQPLHAVGLSVLKLTLMRRNRVSRIGGQPQSTRTISIDCQAVAGWCWPHHAITPGGPSGSAGRTNSGAWGTLAAMIPTGDPDCPLMRTHNVIPRATGSALQSWRTLPARDPKVCQPPACIRRRVIKLRLPGTNQPESSAIDDVRWSECLAHCATPPPPGRPHLTANDQSGSTAAGSNRPGISVSPV